MSGWWAGAGERDRAEAHAAADEARGQARRRRAARAVVVRAVDDGDRAELLAMLGLDDLIPNPRDPVSTATPTPGTSDSATSDSAISDLGDR